MKKTLTVNLNGRVFNIDEDAYSLLDNYLSNLRIYFNKEEDSAEILTDFEARIEELFTERVRLGHNVISIEEVEKIIAQMGRPSDFGEEKEYTEENNDKSGEEKEVHTSVKKKLFRNSDDKMLGGVFSGIAAYFDWNVIVVRLIAVVLIFATSFWIIPVYLVAWLIIPEARTAEQKLQMAGKPITVENIGKTVAAGADVRNKKQNSGCLSWFLDFIVAFFKVILVGFGCLVGLPLLFVLVIVVIVLFAVLFGVGSELFTGIFSGVGLSALGIDHPLLATISFCFILGIPLVALIYGIVSYIAKLKPLNKGVKWTGLIVWIIALVAFCFSGFDFKSTSFPPFLSFNMDKSGLVISKSVIKGDGNIQVKKEIYPVTIEKIHLDNLTEADFQIEQVAGESTTVLISGDANITDKIKLRIGENNVLKIVKSTQSAFKPVVPLVIKVKTTNLERMKLDGGGNVDLVGAFRTKKLYINMEGAGKISADSLYTDKLNVKMGGMGSIILGGKAKNATFDLEGAGQINAFKLVSDSVYARLEGIGSIQCNAEKHIDGKVRGIGKLTYKKEPETKNLSMDGIGKIGLE